MKRISRMNWRGCSRVSLLMALAMLVSTETSRRLCAQNGSPLAEKDGQIVVLAIEGADATFARSGTEVWATLEVGQVLSPGDRGRTGPRTRLMLRLASAGEISIPERSEFLVESPPVAEEFSVFTILKGMGYFFHRGEPSKVRFKSRTASAAVRGTEFLFKVDEEGKTELILFDGEVELSNDSGRLTLLGRGACVAEPGQEPVRTPMLEPQRALQWRLYYPAVLDLEDLQLEADAQKELSSSLAFYRQGDLQSALAHYPPDRSAASPDESIFLGALLLSVGQVAEAELLLSEVETAGLAVGRLFSLSAALRTLIQVIRSSDSFEAEPRRPLGIMATPWMARSYVEQGRGDLPEALRSARRAVEISPSFGFAWVRLAELEFSFGLHREALGQLHKGLELTPRHAEAYSLQGFLMSARNETERAIQSFDKAIELDGGLGHAWLGRGLGRIRQGEISEGLVDLEVAAATEPQRSFLRSYLGKGFALAGRKNLADREFQLAKELDPEDPTGWLYSALFHQQNSRINEAIEELETSQALNDHRQVFRSSFLLDQDQAVRGANLAGVYVDAGMDDVGYREAVRAVNTDYGNYAAHVFLANNYNQRRDPTRVSLRYDSAWFSEYLLANLLAPPGAGVLSQTVSQQEYGRLFERNKLGIVASGLYLSSGDWSQAAAALGHYGDFAFAIDQAFQSRGGQRVNNDLEQWTVSLQLKQRLRPEDSVFFQAIYFEAQGGDLAQVYNPNDPRLVNRGFRFEEQQEPMLIAGYHHEWSPSSHTLVVAGRVDDRLQVRNPGLRTAVVARDVNGDINDALPILMDERYESDLDVYSAEAQHIWQAHDHTWIVGSRYQFGQFEAANELTGARPPIVAPLLPEVRQQTVSDFQRWSSYGYYQWRVVDPLMLVGGMSYDWIKYPVNHRFSPISDAETSRDAWLPKGGFLWIPSDSTAVRGAYSRSLGGVSLEQSLRLEPTQVAGFNQAYSSLIPESSGGTSSAAEMEAWGLEWDRKLGTRTYLGVRGEWLESEASRTVGVFDLNTPPARTAGLDERLDYRERGLTVTLHQLIAEAWAAGAMYRVSQAELEDRFVGVPAGLPGGFEPSTDVSATLQQVRFFALFNHPSGIFGQLESVWSSQNNGGDAETWPDDEFWHFNAWIGYRFYQRRAEVRVGLLNITDQDYRLNPINLTPELQRDRTLALSLKVDF